MDKVSLVGSVSRAIMHYANQGQHEHNTKEDDHGKDGATTAKASFPEQECIQDNSEVKQNTEASEIGTQDDTAPSIVVIRHTAANEAQECDLPTGRLPASHECLSFQRLQQSTPCAGVSLIH